MDRRWFLKAAFGAASAMAVGVSIEDEARAMPIAAEPMAPAANLAPSAAVATPEDLEAAKVEDVYYYFRRRHHRRRRYFFYRPRRRFHRRRYFRRRFFFY